MAEADRIPVNCDVEPIHAPGSIQPFGALVAAGRADDLIAFVSGNADAQLGHAADALLGRPLADLLGAGQLARLKERATDPASAETLRPFECTIEGANGEVRGFEGLVHTHGGFTILELLGDAGYALPEVDAERFRRRFVSDLGRPESEREIANVLAPIFRFFTGFDRVMVYRFHEDWHGEVIAEDTEREDRFLGLHFPDTDIPAPAREAYRLNPIRLIADVAAAPVALLSRPDLGQGASLDLTYSKLRSVAPVHIQYLKNMGVSATASVSLVVNGELWGLISCHHYAPRTLPPAQMQLCDVIAQMASGFIERVSYSTRLRKLGMAHRLTETLDDRSRGSGSLRDVIERSADDLQRLVPHDGLAIMIDDCGSVVGGERIPPPAFAALAGRTEHGVLVARSFSQLIPLTANQKRQCAGGAFLQLSEDGSEYLVLMRKPYPAVVNWGGEPKQAGPMNERGVRRLEPRQSFALWQERFDEVCEPFDADDVEVLKLVRGTLARLRAIEREHAARAARQASEAKEAELRMQLLHAARVSSMNELGSAFAHELNQPLTAVMNYVTACRELLRPYEQDLPTELIALMEDGLEQAERAGAIVQRLRGLIEKGELDRREIDLSTIVAAAVNLVLPMQQADDVEIRLELDPHLPPILADRIQIEQVMFNLVRNAIEAMVGSATRILTIGTLGRNDDAVEAWIRDTGSGIPESVIGELFRPLVSVKEHGMGIGLSLCRSIVEAHGGSISARNWGGGAEFRFVLPVLSIGE